MRSIRIVTAVLLIATIGVGCSKRESRKARAAREAAAQAEAVKPQRASAAPVRISDEGVVPSTKPSATVSASFADGEAAFKAKSYKEATAIFEAYVDRKPGNGWGYYMLGLSAWKSGDFPKAEKAFGQALSIDPNHVKSLVNSARLFIDQKRQDDAIERLTLAAQIDPESTEVHRLLAQTYRDQGKTDEAIEAYRRAIDLNERDVWSLNSLGLLLEQTGDVRAAAEAFRDALLVDPRYETAKQNLARVEAVKSGMELK